MMATYVVCGNPEHDKFDQRKTDCNECAAEDDREMLHGHTPPQGNPRVTPEATAEALAVPAWAESLDPNPRVTRETLPPKYPGRRRRYEAGDRVRVIMSEGKTIDGTPLMHSTGVVARNETQYVEVINDYDGSPTPFNWQALQLIEAVENRRGRRGRKFENLAAAHHAATAPEPCKECVKLRAIIRALLDEDNQ
jgi:hypothetical protein